jgi:hypothetical protein
MARWLVTQGDRQFSAQDLAELKELAAAGKVGPGDMVQPPGATDWLYASELPELKGLLRQAQRSPYDDEVAQPSSGAGSAAIMVVLVVLIGLAGAVFYHYASAVPGQDDLRLLGKDKGGLSLTEMLVTASPAQLRSAPDANADTVATIAKDSRVQLEGKRKSWYHIKTNNSMDGWVTVDAVVPAYFFADATTREDYDPLYNPDRYIFVKNSSWMQLPDQRRENVTIFSFLLQNKSKFEMTDIKLLATIKDKNDNVLETKEIAIEGVIPPFDGAMVGTLSPDRKDKTGTKRLLTSNYFAELAQADDTLNLRWADGVEVQMDSEGFIEANIDLLEVRALPKKLED